MCHLSFGLSVETLMGLEEGKGEVGISAIDYRL